MKKDTSIARVLFLMQNGHFHLENGHFLDQMDTF